MYWHFLTVQFYLMLSVVQLTVIFEYETVHHYDIASFDIPVPYLYCLFAIVCDILYISL